MDPFEAAVAEDYDDIARSGQRLYPVQDVFYVRFVERRDTTRLNSFYDSFRIQSIVHRQLIGSCDPGQADAVRQSQRFRQRGLKDGAPRRVRSRLEDGPDFVTWISMPQRHQRFANRRWVMAKIVDHFDSVDFAAEFLATGHTGEANQC